MANVTLYPEETETKVVVIKPETFDLQLSREEAEILFSILGEFSPNEYTSPIFEALSQAGITDKGHVTVEGRYVGVLKYVPSPGLRW